MREPMRSATRQAEVKSNLREYHGWSIEKGWSATLAEGHMNARAARSLAHIGNSFSRILNREVMLDIGGKDTKRIKVLSIESAEADSGDSRIATLEKGLSSPIANFIMLISNLGGVMSDGETGLTISRTIRDYIHLGRLRRESRNGKKDSL